MFRPKFFKDVLECDVPLKNKNFSDFDLGCDTKITTQPGLAFLETFFLFSLFYIIFKRVSSSFTSA